MRAAPAGQLPGPEVLLCKVPPRNLDVLTDLKWIQISTVGYEHLRGLGFADRPVRVVILSAGLKGIPLDLLEAARVDGANEWQAFRHIIIPTLRPAIIVVATTLVINAMKLFDLIWVMTGGRFQTDVVATLFFKQAFITRDFGVGAALAFILLLAVIPLMAINVRLFRVEVAE